MNIIIAVALILNVILGPGQAEFVCDNTGSAPHTGTYPVLPSVFKTRVEINYKTEKRSATTQWFYDFDKRKAAIDIKENNYIYKRIYNYETNEIFDMQAIDNKPSFPVESNDGHPIYPFSCTTKELSTYKPDNPVYDLGSLTVNGLLYPKRSIDIFQFYPEVTLSAF